MKHIMKQYVVSIDYNPSEFTHHTLSGMEQDCAVLDRYEIKYSVKTID